MTRIYSHLGIVGGSGLSRFPGLAESSQLVVHTPFGEPSSPLTLARLNDVPVVFLPRHGQGHTIPPHEVNYRANLAALHQEGVHTVIAVTAVGAINRDLKDGDLVICDQIIDYTHGREATFFDGHGGDVTHVDFSNPYTDAIREVLICTAKSLGLRHTSRGTYGATQGPRFETAAEIERMGRDGADVVGMTGMPEAILARELQMQYATISLVVNPAASRDLPALSIEQIKATLEAGMASVHKLIHAAAPAIYSL